MISQGTYYIDVNIHLQIKCVAIDEELNFICEKAVRFDTDLPEFK